MENDQLQERIAELLLPCIALINAYARAEPEGASVDLADVDHAHEVATSIVESNFDLQRCDVCREHFVPGYTVCGCS